MKYLVIALLLCTSLALQAEVHLSSIFTDGMVLQQQQSVPLWGRAESDAAVQVTTSWDQRTYDVKANKAGVWRVFVQTPVAGGPYRIQFTEENTIVLDDVLIGEVWLCSGQSNMEMPLKGYPGQPIIGSTEAILTSRDEQLRIYTVPRNPLLKPAEDSKPSTWKKANPQDVANFSATAYFFGRSLRQVLDVPVGLIHSSYGGSNIEAWMEAAWLADIEGVEIPQEDEGLKNKNRQPTMLYNGMIHPLIGYGIKGIIWYQGESNYETSDRYEILFPRMVEKYRALWQDDTLPFYFTQIAPFDYASLPPYYVGGKYNSAFIRDAQRKSLANIPHSGMAVTMDLGEKNCIHPAHKQEGGERLALLALGDTYGMGGLNHRSPVYKSMSVLDGAVTVEFDDAPLGLTSFGQAIQTFEIADESKIFHPAQALIRGKTVVLSSPHVTKPVAVRYAFKDFVMGDLFGVNGLPVSSFRTDDW